MISIVTDLRLCEVCRTGSAIVYCTGCGIPLCRQCRRFDMYAHDCGSVDTLALCHICFDDIDINPWGGKRPD
ncbi:MAG TPA: hypothetical protein ENO00_08170 [Deltaproteobacteria bacterium]|nr:hypothetical protein [Deltaproteobacteria bacterium]